MKKYLVIAVAVLTSYTMNAQFTIGIDGGLSIPSSDYGSSNISTSGSVSSGFAKLGSCYDIYAGFKFMPFIGGMVQYGVNNNSFDVSKLQGTGTGTFSASSGDKITEYLIGPYASFKLIKIKIEAKLLVGLVSSNYPTISESTTFNGVSANVINSFSTGNSFGYCLGAKVKYMVAGHLGIGLGLDYVGSDVSFKGTETTNYSNTVTPTSNKMNVGVLQATLGLSFDI